MLDRKTKRKILEIELDLKDRLLEVEFNEELEIQVIVQGDATDFRASFIDKKGKIIKVIEMGLSSNNPYYGGRELAAQDPLVLPQEYLL